MATTPAALFAEHGSAPDQKMGTVLRMPEAVFRGARFWKNTLRPDENGLARQSVGEIQLERDLSRLAVPLAVRKLPIEGAQTPSGFFS
jgi:hypothetical protein